MYLGLSVVDASSNSERAIYISDDLIAHTLTDLYILRIVTDEPGYGDTNLERHFLIKRSIETSTIEKH